ncbi:MAG: MFS transporter, partial [Elusimicrobia bacterium]|nr:MFS transporter [Elusimicrobiota bacterium]
MTETKTEETFIGKFMVLKGAVRELWIIFGTKIMTILAYSVVNSTLVLWLSSDLGFGDKSAGFVVATWSTALTIFTVMVGSLVDAVGIRKSLLAGFGLATAARLVMAFCAIKWIALPFGLFPLALGEALQTPVMVAAVKRFTSTKQRSIAFSVYYAMMNVGFAVAGWTFDHVRSGLGEYGHYNVPLLGFHISTYQTIILLGALFTLPNLVL